MSAPIILAVSRDYGYVLLTATGSLILQLWLGHRAASARRAAKIPHPQQEVHPRSAVSKTDPGVSPAEHAFNCAQRAYANFVDAYPAFLTGLFIGGLQYPKVASGLGVFWVVNRVVYSRGYSNPAKPFGTGRFIGGGHMLGLLSLWGLVGSMGVGMLR
ncbi:MAG: hypothetical protein M1814_000012 [Vezdaea aestivalis]|nr:MAG: hypothetical protein M1814_000012 [Vezdaea aestivalis]